MILLSIISLLATLIAFVVFAAPYRDLEAALQVDNVGTRSFVPYLVLLDYAVIWVIYGYLIKSVVLIGVNFFGALMSLYYCMVFLALSDEGKRRQQLTLFGISLLLLEGLITVIYFDGELGVVVLGVCASVLNVAVCAAPLVQLREILRTRSVENLSLQFASASVASGLIWTVFGVLISDLNVAISNALAFAFALVQVMLFVVFRTTSTAHKSPMSYEVDASLVTTPTKIAKSLV
jgi:solute carrier family 50 protein (sugar transporter)